MKMNYLVLVGLLMSADALGMLAVAEAGAAALAANPTVQKAVKDIVSHETDTFAYSSFFSNLFGHSHSDQASSALQTLIENSPAILQQVPAIVQAIENPSVAAAPGLPTMPAANPQQAILGLVLQEAQQAEQRLQTNPSRKAQILRILIGLCSAGFAAADLTVTYVYSQKNTDSGQKATTGVFSAGTDLGILSFGAYQAYLGFVSWDNTAKQKDAAVATKLIQGHIAQLAQPAGSAPAAAARPASSNV